MLPARGTLFKESLVNLPTNLKLFVETDGVFIPPNLAHFQAGGELENICILCTDTSSTKLGNPINPDLELEFANGVTLPICDSCGEEIDDRLKSMPFKEGYSLVKVKGSSVSSRIREFVNDYKYPKNVLSLQPWPYHICGFCENEITEDTYRRIQLPVDVGQVFGGSFNACENCSDELGMDLVPFPSEIKTTCSQCGHDYTITLKEENYRKNHGSAQYDYICGTCFLFEYYGPDFVPNATHDNFIRFKEVKCTACAEVNWLDLMTMPDSSVLKKEHYCRKCNATEYKIPLIDNYELIIYLENLRLRTWSFFIRKTYKNFYESPNTWFTPHEAAMAGTNWFHDFLNKKL